MSGDPDAIAREIEQTRSELAETIDAIAERVSPKRAASRGAEKVRSAFGSLSGSSGSNGHGGNPPAAVLDATPRSASGAAQGAPASYAVQRTLRPERVLLAAGLLAGAAAVVVLWRRRR